MDYLYDESFEGFLCCVFLHYYEEKASGIFPASRYQSNMLSAFKLVETDERQAARVYAAIENKISTHDMKRIYMVFRSSVTGREMKLLRYIRLGFREGSKLRLRHGDPVVFDVQQAELKVNHEVHRMCGLLRFSETGPAGAGGLTPDEYAPETPAPGTAAPALEGGPGRKSILYAPMAPDHDIVEFLAPHFRDRFKEEVFIIHDKRRGKALVSAPEDWYITDFRNADLFGDTQRERHYKQLWREYFDAAAIRERTNPSCQRRFMPTRYWGNLTEFSR
jgi:probable DNA metabolism protein